MDLSRPTLLSFVNYFVYQDSSQSESEDALIEKLLEIEDIDITYFESERLRFFSTPRSSLFNESLENLKQMQQAQQLRCLAWLFIFSRSDQKTDSKEWHLLYRIYAKELNLNLIEIVKVQVNISVQIRNLERTRLEKYKRL